MKSKLKALLSGFLVLSMVTVASPISSLANEIPENSVSTLANVSLPTGIMNLKDKFVDVKNYDFSYVDYSPHYYTTDSGSIYIRVLSHTPDEQTIKVNLRDGDFGNVLDDVILEAPIEGMGVVKFDNLIKDKLYYLDFTNFDYYENPDANITGTLLISSK